MSPAEPLLSELARSMRAEIEALDRADVGALAEATRAKMGVIERLQRADTADAPQPLVDECRELNRQTALRVNLLRAQIDRRLDGLARAAGRQPAVGYGADGRLAGAVNRSA